MWSRGLIGSVRACSSSSCERQAFAADVLLDHARMLDEDDGPSLENRSHPAKPRVQEGDEGGEKRHHREHENCARTAPVIEVSFWVTGLEDCELRR